MPAPVVMKLWRSDHSHADGGLKGEGMKNSKEEEKTRTRTENTEKTEKN